MHSMKEACNCSTPILREMFAEFFNEECDGAEHTLIETAIRPMDRVFAELGNFSDCPVKYRFLRTDGKTVTHVVPPNQIQAFQIPGRIIMVTLTCEACACGHGITVSGNGLCEAGVFITYIECHSCN